MNTIEEIERHAKLAGISANRLQQIQKIVWDYMLTPAYKRDGIEMALKINKLYKPIKPK